MQRSCGGRAGALDAVRNWYVPHTGASLSPLAPLRFTALLPCRTAGLVGCAMLTLYLTCLLTNVVKTAVIQQLALTVGSLSSPVPALAPVQQHVDFVFAVLVRARVPAAGW